MRARAAALCAVLQPRLNRYFGKTRKLTTLARRTSPYESSFGLEDLDVVFEDGTTLALVFKDLCRENMRPEIRDVKPDFLYNPRREIEAYETLLVSAGLGTAACYGSLETDSFPSSLNAGSSYWLFLERVPGAPLYTYGKLDIWKQAARWLARFHELSYRRPDLPAQAGHLLRYDADFYALWRQRARANLEARIPPGNDTAKMIDRLLATHACATDRLLTLPAVWIHGEFYASNVLIHSACEDADGLRPQTQPQEIYAGACTVNKDAVNPARVCPVDWEMTAIGPGLMDLAALIAGDWSMEERESLIGTYYAALAKMDAGSLHPLPPWETFLRDLTCCRLHIALQWLGWQEPAGQEWRPPPDQVRDWLAEAQSLVEELG